MQRILRWLLVLETTVLVVLVVLGVIYGIQDVTRPLPCDPHQLDPKTWCLDLRGLLLELTLFIAFPALLVSAWSVWLLRRPRVWALLVPAALNLWPAGALVYGIWLLLTGQTSALSPSSGGDWWQNWSLGLLALVTCVLSIVCLVRVPPSTSAVEP